MLNRGVLFFVLIAAMVLFCVGGVFLINDHNSQRDAHSLEVSKAPLGSCVIVLYNTVLKPGLIVSSKKDGPNVLLQAPQGALIVPVDPNTIINLIVPGKDPEQDERWGKCIAYFAKGGTLQYNEKTPMSRD